MLNSNKGRVVNIIDYNEDIQWIDVEIESKIEKAVSYIKMVGIVKKGDIVVLNTTAVDLSLGTGGVHFVIYNLNTNKQKSKDPGHIMKLRYTPMQIKCLAAEEQESPYHKKIKDFKNLDNLRVAVGTLHSMLAPVAATIKWLKPEIKISYIMTDGGALPISFSKTVLELKKKGVIDKTITIGHAFGGDLECVNIYTGLITAKEILYSDIVIVTMGPGIVGTGTKYGFSGIEQGYYLDAVSILGGISFAIPRISFKDDRFRHRGISHHTITNLCEIAHTKTNLFLPQLDKDKQGLIQTQISEAGISNRHNIYYVNGIEVSKALAYYKLKTSTMGRGFQDDKSYFYALGAVATGIVNFSKYHL